mgnify:CR=1 FL=1
MKIILSILNFLLLSNTLLAQEKIKGQIFSKLKEDLVPLPGVNIYWLDSPIGTISDEDGKFSITVNSDSKKLIISFLGFQTDTLNIEKQLNLSHVMKESNLGELNEVEVTEKRKSLKRSYLSAQNITKISSEELLKAACCNLSESFETNPSIDINFSDALTGTKQINMLGLSSPYIMITQENIPFVRGASQIYGLTYTPGPWIESIQVTKGTGSVVNGFESIAGQINAELKKPSLSNPFFLNAFASVNGRKEFNFHFNRALSKNFSLGVYGHNSQRNMLTDNNGDGFLDMPRTRQINLLKRLQYTDAENGYVGFLSLRFLNDKKISGETNFTGRNDNFNLTSWGSEIFTQRADATLKIGYVFPLITYQSIGFQTAYSKHNQESFFGLRDYNISHESFYSNLIFNSIISNTKHKFKTGLNFSRDIYFENVNEDVYKRTDDVYGLFFEYTFDNLKNLNLVAGLRLDNHNNIGTFLSPRLHLRYQALDRPTIFRFSVGQGRKVGNIFAENQNIFASNRAIQIFPSNGSIYGLEPEIAWNYGLSISRNFTFLNRNADVILDFYNTTFLNQVVADFEKLGYVQFYNLSGKSYSKSFQIELNYKVLNNISTRIAYKNENVRILYKDGFKRKPLRPYSRFFFNIEYNTLNNDGKGWRNDLTFNVVGKQRVPSNLLNLNGLIASSYSLINFQTAKVFSPKFELYLGGENLFNVRQKNPIIAADNPFGRYFDASLVYAPVFGRFFYSGMRFNIN